MIGMPNMNRKVAHDTGSETMSPKVSKLSKWKTISASLALAGTIAQAGCSSLTEPTGGCSTTSTGDGGSSCICTTDAGATSTGVITDAGQCVPEGSVGSTSGSVYCPQDPNPVCTPQSSTKNLSMDAGSSSTMVLGDYTIIISNASQSGSTFSATFTINDFCGNVLQSQPISLGSTVSLLEDNGNILITMDLTQVDVNAPGSAVVTAVMSCPNVTSSGGTVCPDVTTGSATGTLNLNASVDVAKYDFLYTGNSGGFANITVSCDKKVIAQAQCTLNSQTVIQRPDDNGGRTIYMTASNTTADSAEVNINIQSQ